MKNPWLKKNPLLSLWLSGANSMIGSARGRALAHSRRQASAIMAAGINDMLRLSTRPPVAGPVAKRRKRRKAP